MCFCVYFFFLNHLCMQKLVLACAYVYTYSLQCCTSTTGCNLLKNQTYSSVHVFQSASCRVYEKNLEYMPSTVFKYNFVQAKPFPHTSPSPQTQFVLYFSVRTIFQPSFNFQSSATFAGSPLQKLAAKYFYSDECNFATPS